MQKNIAAFTDYGKDFPANEWMILVIRPFKCYLSAIFKYIVIFICYHTEGVIRMSARWLQSHYLLYICLFVTLLHFAGCAVEPSEQWPRAGRDINRSGTTETVISFPLNESWRYTAEFAPEPAWPEPAGQDYWHNVRKLVPAVTYDRAFEIVVYGDRLFFGSSADNKIRAIDASNGKEIWAFSTEGPVRFAPEIAEGRVYAGSDDGTLYCLNARNGSLVWKSRLMSEDARLPGNGRIISRWPLRSGVLLNGSTVYCTAGLFPSAETYLCALDATNGSIQWKRDIPISPQGYMALTSRALVVPTGRTEPALFNPEDGEYLGRLKGSGGSYAFASDTYTVSGPGLRSGQVSIKAQDNTEGIVSFNGLRMVLMGETAYILSNDGITAVHHGRYMKLTASLQTLSGKRKALSDSLNAGEDDGLRGALVNVEEEIESCESDRSACILWQQKLICPYSLIRAGDILFAGGEDVVTAVRTEDGEVIATMAVDGKAYSLAAADRRLFVSTDKGIVHCFSSRIGSKQTTASTRHTKRPGSSKPNEFSDAAGLILAETGIDKGYCFDIGCGNGRLATELARITGLTIVCVTDNPSDTRKARKTIDDAGLANRVTVHETSLSELPYVHYCANLIISEKTLTNGTLPPSPAEVARILRPEGGSIFLGEFDDGGNGLDEWKAHIEGIDWSRNSGHGSWLTGRRGKVAGSGEWTQLYADAANTSNSGDNLQGPVTVQWYGRPGPRDMIDRHHRPMSSLYNGGRVFIPGNNRIITVDAYNGTPLWEREMPGSRRIGALKDCGNMILEGDRLYIAVKDSCHALNVSDGSSLQSYAIPGGDGYRYDWGYVSAYGKLLIGTAQKTGASFSNLDFRGSPRNGSFLLENDFRDVIASERLFAIDSETGETAWEYRGGTIMNNTIVRGDGTIYFAECRNPAITNDRDGRIRIDHFCARDMYIVALDADSGEKLWERPYSFPFQHIMFASYKEGILLITGTYNKDGNVRYGLYGFNADSCSDRWETHYIGLNNKSTAPFGTGGEHGEQWQHPVIVGRTVYLRPYAFDLDTGEKKDYIAYRGGHGCGGLTGSEHYLYGRGSNPRMYPLDTQETEGIPLNNVSRPGCWLNMIPAGGLILIPESSSGCTCGYPIQTSIAFSPME